MAQRNFSAKIASRGHRMGQSKKNKQIFVQENGWCCFCGGQQPATTEDHVPSRNIFRQRRWPEGFVFPACLNCNSATSNDELIAGLYFRLADPFSDTNDRSEFSKMLMGVRNNYPEVLVHSKMTANEKRAAFKKFELPPPNSAFSEAPMLKITKLARNSITRFVFKLACALHYRHTGRILPAPGKIAFHYDTNVSLFANGISDDVLKCVPTLQVTQRCNSSLGDQFTYRFGHSTELNSCAFVCMIRGAFVITIMTAEDPEVFQDHSELNDSVLTVGGFLMPKVNN
jgi:hypothetical protein